MIYFIKEFIRRELIKSIKLPKVDREKIKEDIYEHRELGVDFYLLSALSAVIATLGLIIDSPATVIGGMLICPLFYPIITMSMIITRGNVKLFEKSIYNLIKLIAVILFFSWLVSVIAPSSGITDQIIKRSEPNILHLFIALFSGAAGAISLLFPRVASSLAGVLVAAAIMPPLGAAGYGLATFNPDIIAGSFLLFITNLLSIVFMGIVLFYIFGFTNPKNLRGKKLVKTDLIWSAILLLIVAVPLFIALSSNIDKENKIIKIRSIISGELEPDTLTGTTNITITRSEEDTKITAVVNRTNLPTSDQYTTIKDKVEEYLGKEIDLELITNRSYRIDSSLPDIGQE